MHVVYPCVDVSSNKKDVIQDAEPEFLASDGRKILLPINRFEQKNIELAIKAFAHLTDQEKKSSKLIIAGMLDFLSSFLFLHLLYADSYDPRVNENISYHNELVALCEIFNLKHITCKNFITSLSIPKDTDVLFLLSIPAS